MKIYTKTGDKGGTSLFGGKRVSKADVRVEAYGTVDELNSAIGIAIAQVQSAKFKVQSDKSKLKSSLEAIQNDLLTIGSVLANPNGKWQMENGKYLKDRVKTFEEFIDEVTGELPELRNFIVPGGSIMGAQLHWVRTIARRAERRIVVLARKEDIGRGILVYFNRLSDLLFTLARYVNHQEGEIESIWKK